MTAPYSPPTKTVSFASSPSTTSFSSNDPIPSTSSTAPSTSSPSTSASTLASSSTLEGASTEPPSTTRPSGPKRRRSSIKQGLQMPYKPPAEYYTHRDPLLRRLRLKNGFGSPVSLEKEFGRDARVVLFFFGASWRGSSKEPFELVSNFQRRFPHQCKVVFVSIDETKRAYEMNSKDRNYLSMEWNDGSNMGSPEDSPESGSEPEDPPPLEPFLLAGDSDLEEETSLSSPPSLYLRPYSRVHLADKWQILGVPNLVVYHLESQKILSYHARFDLLKENRIDSTWEKWSQGEKVTFGVWDFVLALKWTLVFLVISLMYLFAVKNGWCVNYVAMWSSSMSEKLGTNGAKVEL